MKCLYPVLLKDGVRPHIVACGRCVVCREMRVRSWFVRIMAEVAECDYARFLTLTYDDDHIPPGRNLKHEDWQLYVKRVRKELSVRYGVRCKYYMCGEYGGFSGRPHYHAIMMMYGNMPDREDGDKTSSLDDLLRSKWTCGIVDVGYVSDKSVRYCIGYVNKLASKHIGERVRPYQRMSQGLGYSYLAKYEDQLAERKYISYRGVKYDVPRYYRDKSDKVNNAIMQQDYDDRSYELLESNYWDKVRNIKDKARQVERNIEARKSIARNKL